MRLRSDPLDIVPCVVVSPGLKLVSVERDHPRIPFVQIVDADGWVIAQAHPNMAHWVCKVMNAYLCESNEHRYFVSQRERKKAMEKR